MKLRKALFITFAGGLLLVSQQAVTADGAGSLSGTDKEFIAKAARGNLAEIQSSRLVLQRSRNPQVLNVAGKMIEAHTKAQSDLSSLARRVHLALPSAPDAGQQRNYRRLAGLSGGVFEEGYLRIQSADHDAAIGLYQREVTYGSNPNAQGYAARYLPKIQNHAAMISRTASIMGIVVPRPSKVASASNGPTALSPPRKGM
jgi:putative membrane protein